MGVKTIGRFVYDSGTAQTVAADENLVFANATVSNNCLTNAGQGVLKINQPGLYNVFFNATLEGTAEGAVKVQMKHNGTVVSGANATADFAAVGDSASISFASAVTARCCGEDTLTFACNAATSATTVCATIERVA